MRDFALGFVGNGSDKFTARGEYRAKRFIAAKLNRWNPTTMVSGHSPVGGIDIWSEEIAEEFGIELDLKIPEVNQWNPVGGYGYRARNLDIAKTSTLLYVVLADVYPEEYPGRRFKACYHCARARPGHEHDHVKSGGCWTGVQAQRLGTKVNWKIIANY